MDVINVKMRLFVLLQFTFVFKVTGKFYSGENINIDEFLNTSYNPENEQYWQNRNLVTSLYKVCSNGFECVHPIQCPLHIQENENEKLVKCKLSEEKNGYCCPFPSMMEEKKPPIKRSPTHLAAAIKEARKQLNVALKKIEESPTINGTDGYFHQTTSQAEGYEIKALEDVLTVKALHMLENDTFGSNFEGISLTKRCSQSYTCKNPDCRYRTFSGRCNNIVPEKSLWGSANHPMKKLLPPAYEDGVWAPRIRSKTGNFLKSPRLITSKLFPDINHPDKCLNVLMMQFGQFVVHDIVQTATIRTKAGEKIDCCKNGTVCLVAKENIACMPIDVCDDDPFYSKFNVRCLNFVRSKLASPKECKLSYGRQVNAVSHFIDGSHIYGISKNQSDSLRSMKGGQMRIFELEERHLLPLVSNTEGSCTSNANACFLTGDGRSNSIISLTTLHTLFLREHNRLAKILAKINPHWEDEVIFQEARRIVIGEIQHITYNEYLPLLVGPKNMAYFNLYVGKGHSSLYNPNIDPSIASEFGAAAMRMGHSMVPGQFELKYQNVPIPSVMENPTRLMDPTFFDTMLKGMASQKMQQIDNSFTFGLTRFLFPGEKSHGGDLTAVNIQRGRDHGIRPYNDYLELSGYPRVKSFKEFGYKGKCDMLEQVYECPDDIDLYVGGILERHDEEAIVGPTFANIISDQFSRLKHGDRYFYTHGPQSNSGAFTPYQLAEIQKVTLSQIICANADGGCLTSFPREAFKIPCKDNSIIKCKDMPSINYNYWKDCKKNC